MYKSWNPDALLVRKLSDSSHIDLKPSEAINGLSRVCDCVPPLIDRRKRDHFTTVSQDSLYNLSV